MRSVPFEYRQQIFESLYGVPGGGETVTVAGAQVEVSVIDQMKVMRDKAAAKRQSRTDAEQAE